ncbi:MAG: hypothetical protein JST89_01540 [Cyanobacteria bacterium SZAS-4]|nr:hypothetical protein [Cyanobacteria bacterium SZAS-4]
MSKVYGQDFEWIKDPKASADQDIGIIDARTDQRWVHSVETLVQREEWQELWNLAQKAPPIWTIRILKFLKLKSWKPDEAQIDFFNRLNEFASACNDYDLPGPKTRNPQTGSVLGGNPHTSRTGGLERKKLDANAKFTAGISEGRIASARVTADGEFVFVLDNKCTSFEVWRVADLSPVARIRVDLINGRQLALLAFDVSPYGDHLATLLFEPKTKQPEIHLYKFEDDELTLDRWMPFTNVNLGMQVPRLSFSGSGAHLALYSAFNQITVWDVEHGKTIREFKNVGYDEELEFVASAYQIQETAKLHDWCKYGRWAIGENKARALALNDDASVLVAERGVMLNVFYCRDTNIFLHAKLDADAPFALSRQGDRIIARCTQMLSCYMPDQKTSVAIAACSDPALRVAISSDGEIMAASMSHGRVAMLWHLPDGRNLGTLFGLARDFLVELKITDGGSVIAVTRGGLIQVWESDGNGNAWPWSMELVKITHQPVDSSSVKVLRQAQEMRRRGWLSVQESNILDLALSLMQNRLNLDIEIEWDSELPGDVFDIEIE